MEDLLIKSITLIKLANWKNSTTEGNEVTNPTKTFYLEVDRPELTPSVRYAITKIECNENIEGILKKIKEQQIKNYKQIKYIHIKPKCHED